MSEKTEQPTDKKVRDAREKGQVGVSQDITKLISGIVIFATLFAMQEGLMSKGQDIISFSIVKTNTEFHQAAGEVISKTMDSLIGIVLPIVAIAFFIKIAGTWLQIGPMFAPKAVKFDINKLNPMSTLKNLFSAKKFYELANNVFKTLVLFFLFYVLIKSNLGRLFLLPTGDLNMFWHSSAALFKVTIIVAFSILLVFSVFDFGMQKFFHKKSLKMSIDEVKREFKDSEGDPHTKGQRNSMMHEILNSEPENTEALVEQADAVVVNPTHYAVALFYRENKTPLPMMLCKGHDDKAKEIIRYARQKDKPIIRYVWLARTLYAHKGKYIPRPTIQAVAEIYKAIKPLLEDTSTQPKMSAEKKAEVTQELEAALAEKHKATLELQRTRVMRNVENASTENTDSVESQTPRQKPNKPVKGS